MVTLELDNNEPTHKNCEYLDSTFNRIGVSIYSSTVHLIEFNGINCGKLFVKYKNYYNQGLNYKIEFGQKIEIDFIRIKLVSYKNNTTIKQDSNEIILQLFFKNIELKKKMNLLLNE